jgi:hypothetical protein
MSLRRSYVRTHARRQLPTTPKSALVLGFSLCWANSYRPRPVSGSSTRRRDAPTGTSSAPAGRSWAIRLASVTATATPPGRAVSATPRCTGRRSTRTAAFSTGPRPCGSRRSGDTTATRRRLAYLNGPVRSPRGRGRSLARIRGAIFQNLVPPHPGFPLKFDQQAARDVDQTNDQLEVAVGLCEVRPNTGSQSRWPTSSAPRRSTDSTRGERNHPHRRLTYCPARHLLPGAGRPHPPATHRCAV